MSSRRSCTRLLPQLLGALLASAALSAHAAKGDCDAKNQASWPACETGNLCLCAADDVEYRRDKVLLNDVVLYQGGSPLMVQAQHAETPSIDFTDSTWNLSGGVTSRLAQGTLVSDSAVVHILKGDLSAATFHGNPATFDESPAFAARGGASVVNVHGSAKTIDYSALSGGEIRLIDDVQLYDGCKEIHGQGFIYNLAQQSLKSLEPAAGSSHERVHGTFQRGCTPRVPGSAPAASPGAAPAPQSGPAPAPGASLSPPQP